MNLLACLLTIKFAESKYSFIKIKHFYYYSTGPYSIFHVTEKLFFLSFVSLCLFREYITSSKSPGENGNLIDPNNQMIIYLIFPDPESYIFQTKGKWTITTKEFQ